MSVEIPSLPHKSIDGDYLRALRKGSGSSHNNLGLILYARGEAEAAIVEYKKAVRYGTSFADAHYNLGIVYDAMGKNEEAVAAYKKVIESKIVH